MSTEITARDDKRNFVFYLVGTLFFAAPVAHLFFTVWTGGAQEFLLNTVDIPLARAGGESLQAVLMLAGGVFFSLLVLFANDWRKRYQGYILILTTLLVLVVLDLLGIGLATKGINVASGLNIATFLIGVSLGVLTELRRSADGGGDLLSIDVRHEDSTWAHWIVEARNRSRPAEFEAAHRLLVVSIVLVVVAANLLNFGYNQSVLQVLVHAGASAGLLYFVYYLLNINTMILGGDGEAEGEPDETQFEVLGPQQSGKTYLALGINMTVKNDEQYELEGLRGRMPDIVDDHARRITGQQSGLIDWGIGNTMIDAAERVEIEFLRKNTRQGELLSANVNMYDYPGEVLEGLAREYNDKRGRQMTDGGKPAEEGADPDDEPAQSSTDGDSEESLGSIEDIISDVDSDEPDGEEIADAVDDSADPGPPDESDGAADEPASVETIDLADIDGTVTDADQSGPGVGPIANPIDSQDDDAGPQFSTATADAESTADPNGATAPSVGQVTDQDGQSADPADGSSDSSSQSAADPDAGAQSAPNIASDEIDKVKQALIKNVGGADKLLVLIDSQRFLTEGDIIADDPGMMLKEMTQIVQGAGPDEIIPVATKADHFLSEYDGLTEGSTPTSGELEDFSEHVHQRLAAHPMAGNLIGLADYQVFPLFFLTGTGKDGERKLRVKDGQIRPIGYNELIDAVVKQ
jgi:hypothetical protein